MKILRVNSPIVVLADAFAETVLFYERLLNESARARLKNPSGTLDLAVVGSLVIIGGAQEAIATRREMKATFVVDSLEEWHQELLRVGATIVEPPMSGPMS